MLGGGDACLWSQHSEAEAGESLSFEVTLVNRASYGTARAIQRNPVSANKQTTVISVNDVKFLNTGKLLYQKLLIILSSTLKSSPKY